MLSPIIFFLTGKDCIKFYLHQGELTAHHQETISTHWQMFKSFSIYVMFLFLRHVSVFYIKGLWSIINVHIANTIKVQI